MKGVAPNQLADIIDSANSYPTDVPPNIAPIWKNMFLFCCKGNTYD